MMKLTLVGQASIIVETADRVIWTDPWLIGTAFNDSWRLMPEARFDEQDYERITDLWISHEHPDHFHIPTLRSMPDRFKRSVTVWFQHNNSDKLPEALKKFGFEKVFRMPHRKWLTWGKTQAYCAQIGQMDSCLAIKDRGKTLLNINDCEVEGRDCRWLNKDIGPVDVLLNQFSLAGYAGDIDRQRNLTREADRIRQNVVENHRDLHARVTVPIASFIYFCRPDNFYVNEFANRPQDLKPSMDRAGQELVVLYPGDSWDVSTPHDSASAMRRYAAEYANREQWPVDPVETVTVDQIITAFHQRVEHLQSKYPNVFLRWLRPVVCKVPDLDVTMRFSIRDDRLEIVDRDLECDVVINSQPLHFMFRWPWGLQTLGVSARLIVKQHQSNWRRHRIVFSMDNAEVYLRPKLLLTKHNIGWVLQRLSGGVSQLRYQLRRM